MFDPTKFKAAEVAPDLCGGIGGNDIVANFVEEFGAIWKRTPVNGVFYVASKTRDIIITYRCHDSEMAMYEVSFEYFKQHFKNGIDAHYFKQGTHKYPYLAILDHLTSQISHA